MRTITATVLAAGLALMAATPMAWAQQQEGQLAPAQSARTFDTQPQSLTDGLTLLQPRRSHSRLRSVGMRASPARRCTRFDIRRRRQGNVDHESAPQVLLGTRQIEPARWLKAIYFDSGAVDTPEQAIAKAYESMLGVERPEFVPR